MRSIFLGLFIASLCFGCSSDKLPDSAERKQLFDYNWKFQLGDLPEASEVDYDDSSWRNLDLPHDWSIESRPKITNTTGNDGGYFQAGIGWYRKTFEVPVAWEGKKVSVYFGGVYMNAEVFINGQSLGTHPYGYTSFSHDLTPYLKYGNENTLAVKVDNSIQKNSRWYSGSGIYRHVWMQVTNPVHIAQWGVAITTPSVSQEKAIVSVASTLENETAQDKVVSVSTRITKGEVGLAEVLDEVEIPANSEITLKQELEVSNPDLWSPENPSLYNANVSIISNDESVDEITEEFGIRSIDYSAESGFLLNGQSILLNGGCVHHDNGALGAKAYDRAEVRKVELLKQAGFNAVRTAHNPPSEAFLAACDRLGLLVVDEAFDGWRTAKAPQAPKDYSLHFDDWWQRDIESMIYRDRNHPSIIMWSTGNEIIERTEPQAVKTANMLATHVRSIDPTRPVTSALTTWDQGWERFDPLFAQHDIGGYNYQLFRAVDDHERVPDRIMVSTESYPRDAFAIWNMVHKYDYIIGDFVWTAMDYLGESGIGAYYYPDEKADEHWVSDRYPWHGAYCGDIDLTGWRKPISHYRNLLWNESEKLYMAVREPNPEEGQISLTGWAVWPTWESWNWPEYEGKTVEVEVYSKYPKVQLYQSGELIGEKETTITQEFKAVFPVTYEPGELKAVAIKNGQRVDSTLLATAGEPADIRLSADRKKLEATGQDLSYVTVEIVDAEGLPVPNANHQLQFSINGPGVIEAVDNANLKDNDLYTAQSRKAWNGRALVVIRGFRKPGTVRLTAEASGLGKSEITLEVQ
ncbi:glycoside hydrolase family 2 TIM barrel-domain containing protein [Marinoscillum sp.]|uniref:glycoside hydrolase family 2 TIM barrel-domain containing protein n=1 Tax=Marinoscillum sp. TaxID=2024838 RepID=UPI003BAADF47